MSVVDDPPVEVPDTAPPVHQYNNNFYGNIYYQPGSKFPRPKRRQLASDALSENDDVSLVEIPIEEEFSVRDKQPTMRGMLLPTFGEHMERRIRYVPYPVKSSRVRPANRGDFGALPAVTDGSTQQQNPGAIIRRDFARNGSETSISTYPCRNAPPARWD